MAGFFVVLEGPDGVGKTTQARLLAAWLRETGREVVECREPGGTDLGEMVRQIVKGQIPFAGPHPRIPINPRAELLLFSAARAQLVDDVILPALERGAVVVCDRFTLSTWVYQGALGGCTLGDVGDTIDVATSGLTPDLTILLDAHPATLAARKAGPDDRIESAFRERLGDLRDAYRAVAELQEAEGADVAFVPANGEVPAVHALIRAVVSEALGLPGTGHAGPG